MVPVAVSAHNGILATARPIEGIVIDGDAGDWPATTICARCWDIHGRSCARRIGLKITHPDDLAADVEQFERVFNDETAGYSIDKRFIRKDGRVIDTIMSFRGVRTDDGEVEHGLAIVPGHHRSQAAGEPGARTATDARGDLAVG
ncbi:MAG TPA: hypothetical protein DGN59_04570 [Candidatus Latescibacteria bacterium]|nr:hypothetical protein [Candidatus Latescibacterota bacterium]